MKSLFALLVICIVTNFAWAGPKATKGGETKFGGTVTQNADQTLNQLVKNFEKLEGQTVAFTATPKKVCEAKGCWMVLQDGDTEIRTTFKDYGFFVPKEILGKKVKVQGQLEKKELSAAAQRHYLKDEGAPQSEIDKIKKAKVEYQFVADGVEII